MGSHRVRQDWSDLAAAASNKQFLGTVLFPCHVHGPLLVGIVVVVIQSPSHVWLFGTPWTAACQTSLSLTIFQFAQVHIHWISDAIQLSHPLKPSSLPSVFHSIRVFSRKSAVHIRWPKYWNFTFSISPSNEYSGLVSFKIDYFDLLAFQGTLKSFPQHYSLKASILWHSAFFVVQISHLYMTTGKTVTLTI